MRGRRSGRNEADGDGASKRSRRRGRSGSPARRKRGSETAGSSPPLGRRWPALVLIVALLVGGIVVGRDGASNETAAAAVDPSTLLPVAAPADALGSLWFCAGQSAGEDTPADGTLVIANPSEVDAVGQVEVVSSDGDREVQPLEVAAWTTERVRVADVLEAEWAAAQVETTVGTVVVEHEVTGEHGSDVAPCQTRAGDRLLLPAGATTRDATLTLLVYNPYSDAATVDISFATDDGVRRPRALQGLPVPAGAVVPVEVSPLVTVRPLVATTITARQGRVVVDRIQIFDGRGAATTEEEAAEELFTREGLTVTPAVPRAALVWSFPAGLRSDGVHEQITVFNPSEETAEVEITLALRDPQRNGVLDPFTLEVPAGEAEVFDVDAAEAVPERVTHSVEVRSTNGVPVVAERSLSATEGTSYRAQLTSTGTPVAAPSWVFAAGPRPAAPPEGSDSTEGSDTTEGADTTDTTDGPEGSDSTEGADTTEGAASAGQVERIALFNPGDQEVEITLTAFGDGERRPLGDEPVVLAAGEHIELDLRDLGGLDEGQTSLLVEADAPITAERRLISVSPDPESDDAPGIGGSTAIGVPLPPGIVVLD